VILVDTNVLVAAARTADTPPPRRRPPAARDRRPVPGRADGAGRDLLSTAWIRWPAPEVAFLRSIAAGELELAVLTVADVVRMAELAERYADLGLGGTDASLVALAERLGLTTLATFDHRHFTVVRPAHTPSFTLLPA